MVLLSEQLKIINRLFPIKFSEDEFRLEKELTYKRVYGRLNDIGKHDLLELYYNIYLNYLEKFEDPKNVYLNLIYTIFLDVLKNRDIDYDKFVFKQKAGAYNANIIAAIIGIAFVIFFRNLKALNMIFFAINLLIIMKWESWVRIWAKKLKVKLFKLREMKTAHIIFMISNIFITILQLRDGKSVLFLLLMNLFLIICHLVSTSKLNNTKSIMSLEKGRKKILLKLYELGVLAFLIWSLVAPTSDLWGYYFGGDNIKYFEGICSETHKKMFGFSKSLVNDIEIITYSDKIKLGNYYTIVYGEKTGAVLEINEVDITD